MEKQILAKQYPFYCDDNDNDNDDDNATVPLLQGSQPSVMTEKAIEAGYGYYGPDAVPAVVAKDAPQGHDPHAQAIPVSTPGVATAPRRSPILTRLRTRWTFLSKRTKYIIYGVAVALVLLIIGLAVGLGVKAHQDDEADAAGTGPTHTGDLTYYDPGLGACGRDNTSGDSIVAVSHVLFDAAQKGSNPNSNPLCGKKIRISRDGKHVVVTVVDRCVGCKEWDLDVTSSVFSKLADIDVGRTTMTWQYL